MLLAGCTEAPLVVPRDSTGDGVDDLLFLTADAKGVAHVERVDFEGQRLQRFGPPTFLPQWGEELNGVEMSLSGDFDGDGVSDVALVVAGPYCWSRVDVLLEGRLDLVNRRHWWGSATYCASSVPAGATGDFDGDGMADLALLYDVAPGRSRLDVFRSTGDSFAEPETWWSSDGYFAQRVLHLASGDFNRDGTADLAALYDYGECQTRGHVFISEQASFSYGGPGGWWQGEDVCAESIIDVAIADIDRDGRTDDIATLYRRKDGRMRIDALVGGESALERTVLWERAGPAPLGGDWSLVAADLDDAPGADLAIVRRGVYCKMVVDTVSGDGLATGDIALAPEHTVMQNSSCDKTTVGVVP
jgi:hypothetical protein